jgi:hypothetical protein
VRARVILLDDFPGQGLGHVMLGLSKYFQLVLQLAPAVSLRFAFCLPPSVERAQSRLRLPRAVPCSPDIYSHHDVLSFGGLRNFRPAVDDFAPGAQPANAQWKRAWPRGRCRNRNRNRNRNL